MPTPADPVLYERANNIADAKYSKPSAYKSGFIVKTYKEMGGTYLEDQKPKNTGLSRWFKEDWRDVGGLSYPVYRPTKKVSKKTPLTPREINEENLRRQILLKQILKGAANLPPFLPK